VLLLPVIPTETLTIIILLILFVIFSFVLNLFILIYYLFFHVLAALFRGAFFAASKKDIVEKMILISDIKPGEKAVDLGSGDGRLVIALASAGAEAHGYEINPFLVWSSRKNIEKAGLVNRAFIHWKNFWTVDFSEFDIVTVFGIGYMMKKLEVKLKKELKPNSKVVSNYFVFPNWPYSKKEDNVLLYKK